MAMLIAPDVLALKKAAMNAVMVVPRLAPRIKGAALRSETIRCATIGTTTEVVMVLERMAAVVTVPQKNDFHAFLKKKRLKRSGELASNNPEISFLKKRIDVNNRINDNAASRNPLGIIFTIQPITGPNMYHFCEKALATGVVEG
jgi:hypothetical protein